MITFLKKNNKLILVYEPENGNTALWVDQALKQNAQVSIGNRVFSFTSKCLLSDDNESEERCFQLGSLQGDYYKIPKKRLNLKNDLFLEKNMRIDRKTFIAEKGISIFRKVDELIEEKIFVGGDDENGVCQASCPIS